MQALSLNIKDIIKFLFIEIKGVPK